MNESQREDQLLLGRHIYQTIMNRTEAFSAEHSLTLDPRNMRLRASLLLLYNIWGHEPIIPVKVSEARLKHIFWFVENVPDWKFCGADFLYLSANAPGYDQLKNLWLQKISESPNLMRRINAYMLFARHGDAKLEDYFQTFFAGREDSLWVRAVREMDSVKKSWIHDAIVEESCTEMPTEPVISALTELANDKKWDRVAVEYSEQASIADFKRARAVFKSQPDLSTLALIAGYSWPRYGLHSAIRFDPEVLLVRLGLASWILRHVPGSRLTKSPFFMEPFTDVLVYPDFLEEASEYLTNLWISQIQRSPDDSQIAKNAAYFRTCIDIKSPALAKRISGELRKSTVGKKALRSCHRR